VKRITTVEVRASGSTVAVSAAHHRAARAGLRIVGVEVDDRVEELLGGRITAGPVGLILGERYGPKAIARALTRAVGVDAGQ
jgi:hypothetical protein